MDTPTDRRMYKKLITDIAEDLQHGDVQKLAFQHDISNDPPQTALEIFKQLEKKGLIGQSKIMELKEVLASISRSDLISSKVEPLQQQLPSNPGNMVRSGCMSTSQHTVPQQCPISQHNGNLSMPSQESCSSATNLVLSVRYTKPEPDHYPTSSSTAFSPSACPPISEEDVTGSNEITKRVSGDTHCYSSLPGRSRTVGFSRPQMSDNTQTTLDHKRHSLTSYQYQKTDQHQGVRTKAIRGSQSPIFRVGSECPRECDSKNTTEPSSLAMSERIPVPNSVQSTSTMLFPMEDESSFSVPRRSSGDDEPSHKNGFTSPIGVSTVNRSQETKQVQDHTMLQSSSATRQKHAQGACLRSNSTIQVPDKPLQGKEFSGSLQWSLRSTKLIERVRKKSTKPFTKTLKLSVGCCYGKKIEAKLYLLPYENASNRYISLQARVTIPRKCSQRRLFIHSCECLYRLSVDIYSNSLKIAHSKSKDAQVEPSDDNNEHNTIIYIDNVLQQSELLHHNRICFSVSLKLLLIGQRSCTPKVHMVDNEEDQYVVINNAGIV